jgi:hypothetical protein
MNSPKEKAEELVLKYLRVDNNTREWFNTYIAKQCALIAINEMLDFRNALYINDGSLAQKYLLEVKNEIIKI